MGGKSSSAPAPDPQLIAAQIRSMGIQDDAIQEIMSNSRALQPLQRQQMQFGLDSAKTAYNQSQEDRQWMLGRRSSLSGLQDQLIADANNFNTEDRREQLAGQAMADVNTAFGQQQQQMQRGLSRMGVNPNSGKFAAMSNANSVAAAAAQANAANKVRAAARQEGYALTDRASNALAGYPAMGMQATGQGAQFGGLGLSTANAGLAGMNSGFQSASSSAGQMGSNATSMWNGQMNAYLHSQDQSNQGMGAMLGAGATVAAAMI